MENASRAARFEGRVAVVTGAGSGIGQASAVALASEGAQVVVNDLKASAAEATCKRIADAGGFAEAVVGDVMAPGFVDKLLDEAVERHGRLDVLHNNVGFGSRGAITEITDEVWARGMDGNLGATFRGVRAALRIMGPRGGGAVVNTASLSGVRKVPGVIAYYGVAKAAVLHLTREAAVEGGPLNVRVNAVTPGSVITPAFMGYLGSDEALLEYERNIPLRRAARPEDVANLVTFLASDEAALITGASVPIDGGFAAVMAQQAGDGQ